MAFLVLSGAEVSPPAMMIRKRILYRFTLAISVIRIGLILFPTEIKSPLDGVLAASYVSPKRDLYEIEVGIAVVGGENAIQRPGGGKAEYAKSPFLIPERIYYFHFPNQWKWPVSHNFPGFGFSIP